jgi:hypothetical protein
VDSFTSVQATWDSVKSTTEYRNFRPLGGHSVVGEAFRACLSRVRGEFSPHLENLTPSPENSSIAVLNSTPQRTLLRAPQSTETFDLWAVHRPSAKLSVLAFFSSGASGNQIWSPPSPPPRIQFRVSGANYVMRTSRLLRRIPPSQYLIVLLNFHCLPSPPKCETPARSEPRRPEAFTQVEFRTLAPWPHRTSPSCLTVLYSEDSPIAVLKSTPAPQNAKLPHERREQRLSTPPDPPVLPATRATPLPVPSSTVLRPALRRQPQLI